MPLHSDPDRPRPRRSLWRFRLSSLFVFIVIAAISIRGFQIWRAHAHTTAVLAMTTEFDFLDTPLADILDLLGNRHELRFQTELPDADRLVRYKGMAPLSQVLDEVLDQHDCEYSVTLGGTILVRSKSTE